MGITARTELHVHANAELLDAEQRIIPVDADALTCGAGLVKGERACGLMLLTRGAGPVPEPRGLSTAHI